MSFDQQFLSLEGLDAGVSLQVDAAFLKAVPLVLGHWPFRVMAIFDQEIFASIVLENGFYTLSSPFLEKAASYKEPVNALCALVAELAWARLREDPSLLCLHGAAAAISGRLMVFPATRRAGKSTLSVALAAEGMRLFTDDFLPVSVAESGIISGISSGVSPRLRRPLPPQIGPVAKAFIAARETLSNPQYTYVPLQEQESGRFGEAVPLGAIIFLNREDGATPALTAISKAEALKTLICQNFSRTGNAGDILAMLEFLAQNLPVYALVYDEAEPAVALLKARFSSWAADLPRYRPEAALENETAEGLKPFTRYADVSTGQFEHADGVRVVASEGKRFLTGRNGQSIHYLNEGAALIWQILSEPTSTAEAAEILLAAFPEQGRAQIEGDVLRSFTEFGQNGLLRKTETPPVAAPQPATASQEAP